MRPDDQIEILVSGPMGQRAAAVTALKQAGVRDEEFCDADHGFAREHCEDGEAWLAFRADAPDADAQAHHLAKVAGVERYDWRLRLHRHYLPRAPRPSQPDPFAELAELKARLAALEQGRPFVPPIGGGAQNTPAYVISAAEHPAHLFRQASQSFLSGTGVIGSGDYLVSPNSPAAMNVLVAPGTAWIPGTIGSSTGFGSNAGAQSSVANTNGGSTTTTGFPASFTSQGDYFGFNDAQVTLGIASANPTNPRIDEVALTVLDAEYAGSSNTVVLQVVTGTAGATPAPPTVPQNSIVLSSVWVPAAASSITSGDLNDLRTFASGVPSARFGTASARPAAASSTRGQIYKETDTGLWSITDGASWFTLLTLGEGPFAARAISGAATANVGDWIIATGGGYTLTLPAPSANAIVAITAKSQTGVFPLTVSGTNIYGQGLSAATSFLLGTSGTSVVLQSDGTNWIMVAGQQDTGWVPLTLTPGVNTVAGSYTPSARVIGNRVELSGDVLNATGGTVASGTVIATLPAVAAPASILNEVPCGCTTAGVPGSLTISGTQIKAGFSWLASAGLGFDSVNYRLF